MNDYYIHLLILICIYLIFAQGLNIIFGLGGLLNLAHVACYAIGAYTTALLSTDLAQPVWVCLPASMILSGFFALIIGAIALRLTEDYFAIGSLAFSAVVSALLVNWKSLTRGVLGIPGIPRPEILQIDFYENKNFLIFAASLAFLTLIFVWFLFRSKLSRSLRALAENEYSGAAVGKDRKGVRNIAFSISATLAGLAGSLFAYYINYIDPSSFTLTEMVFVLSIVIVGKPGSFWGVNLATIFLVLLPEPLRQLEIPPSVLGPMRQMLYALILFGVVFWRRRVLFPVERRV
jgi:branched-chain amino acid transport system permease protein